MNLEFLLLIQSFLMFVCFIFLILITFFSQVPECIDKLAQAGLKIWLLTGDKKETAVNIG